MPDILAVATLASTTGMAKDAITNSFAVKGANDLTVPTLDVIAQAIENFYNDTPTGGLSPLCSIMASTVSRVADASTVDLYDVTNDLDGSPHGSPVFSVTWQVGPIAGGRTDLPAEVAYVATIEASGRADQPVERPDGADPGDEVDRPRQRYTGRVYLGPFNDLAGTTIGGVYRPSSQARDTARLAFVDLATDLSAPTGAGGGLAVWSRRDQVMRLADAVSLDNAFDTQRRRGQAPTIRVRELLPS